MDGNTTMTTTMATSMTTTMTTAMTTAMTTSNTTTTMTAAAVTVLTAQGLEEPRAPRLQRRRLRQPPRIHRVSHARQRALGIREPAAARQLHQVVQEHRVPVPRQHEVA